VVLEFLLALALAGLALLVRESLNPVLHTRAPYLFSFIPLVLTAVTFGFGPALLVTAVNVVWVGVAYYHFPQAVHLEDLVALCLFAFVGSTIAWLGEAQKRARNVIKEHADQLEVRVALRTSELTLSQQRGEVLMALTTMLADLGRPEAVAELAADRLLYALGGEAAVIAERSETGWRSVGTQTAAWTRLEERLQESPNFKEMLSSSLAQGIPQSLTVQAPSQMPVALTLSPIPGPLGRSRGALILAREATLVWTSEEQLFLTRAAGNIGLALDRAQASVALQERSQDLEDLNLQLEGFASSISHDLGAPVRHVLGFAAMIERRDQLDTTDAQHLGRITSAANRMGQMINGLLSFSRASRQHLRVQQVDLSRLVPEVWAQFQPDLQDRTVEFHLGELPTVPGDAVALRSVFENLLSNAVKYSRHRSPARISVEAAFEADGWVICVQDNGAGFNPKYSHRLFEMFQRLHREDEFEGTGIGLATVARLVQRHGGRVWAEGDTDAGATLYVYLPGRGAARSADLAAPRPTALRGER